MHSCGKTEDLVEVLVLLVGLDGVEVNGHIVCLEVLRDDRKVSMRQCKSS